jgi:hypothetical protein
MPMLAILMTLTTAAALGQAPDAVVSRELFADPTFERGFMLTAASHPVPKLLIGALRTTSGPDSAKPAWRMPQWGTRELLEPRRCVDEGGKWTAENRAKRVVVDRSGPGPVGLLLEVRGDFEYDGRMRAVGEAWPHLLIEQLFREPIALKDFKTLTFAMEARIPFCKPAPWAEGKLDAGRHTAQVSAFWTVHNVTKGNPDHRDMIWFGIPFFDARHAVPPSHFALDVGKDDATGKFISLLDGERFWKAPTGDGAWHRLEVDMAPLLREALEIAQRHGHLKHSRPEDLAIDSFNLGWEAPGPYDAAFEVRGLSLRGGDE